MFSFKKLSLKLEIFKQDMINKYDFKREYW